MALTKDGSRIQVRIGQQTLIGIGGTFGTGSTGYVLVGKVPASMFGSGQIEVDGSPIKATEKIFATGSKGWHMNGKAIINGRAVQISGNATVIGSKPDSKIAPNGYAQVSVNAIHVGSKAAAQAAPALVTAPAPRLRKSR